MNRQVGGPLISKWKKLQVKHPQSFAVQKGQIIHCKWKPRWLIDQRLLLCSNETAWLYKDWNLANRWRISMQIRPERLPTASRAQLLWVGGQEFGVALLPVWKHATWRAQHVWSHKLLLISLLHFLELYNAIWLFVVWGATKINLGKICKGKTLHIFMSTNDRMWLVELLE